MTLEKKVEHAKELIANAIKEYKRTAVACSFGKDSMVAVHLSRNVNQSIPVFSIMTIYKPKETFQYLKEMNRKMNLNLRVYIVAEKIPEELKDEQLDIKLLSFGDFYDISKKNREEAGKELYEAKPDECCRLLKVEPTKIAVKDLDAWITGLRRTEGRIREDYQEIEKRGNLVKINPILDFTESDVLEYLQKNNIPLHPFYSKEFEDGRKYRSLGCWPCTRPIFPYQLEREGRWQDTSKCGGECGIHTQTLK